MKKSLPNFLYYSSKIGMGFFGLIIPYVLFIALLAFTGLLPENFNAFFEVPIELEEPSAYFAPHSLDENFEIRYIEIKKANLEILPKERNWAQSLAYVHASFYLSLYFFILYFLGKIFESFKDGESFSAKNPTHVRKIGFIAIILGFYEYLIILLSCTYFHDKFELAHGTTIPFPSLWEINYSAVFMGLIFLALAEVFNQGRELQELESQTV
ncbi:MAG: DUF2975 domain-containing protein [Bacteroidota bacterium]